MKQPYSFKSILGKEMDEFIKIRKSQGHIVRKEKHTLSTLDGHLQTLGYDNKNLTPDVIEGWMLSLPREINVNTKIVYLSHYTQFARFLTSLGHTAFIPERPIDDKHYIPYIFTEKELDRLAEAADHIFSTIIKRGKRGCACFSVILRILIGCGLRLNEALFLNTSDIDIANAVIYIRSSKGNKDRLVPMHESLTAVLKTYLDSDIPIKDGLLFPNRNGKAYSQTWARGRFNQTLSAAGIEKPVLERYERNICIHCLRHTFAVASFRKQCLDGKDMYGEIPVLSTYMGHDRIYGTEKYLHMTTENSEDILACMENFNEGLFPEVNL